MLKTSGQTRTFFRFPLVDSPVPRFPFPPFPSAEMQRRLVSCQFGIQGSRLSGEKLTSRRRRSRCFRFRSSHTLFSRLRTRTVVHCSWGSRCLPSGQWRSRSWDRLGFQDKIAPLLTLESDRTSHSPLNHSLDIYQFNQTRSFAGVYLLPYEKT